MSESIFVRVQRVVSAGVDSAVSTVERANTTGMMRDALREADRAIDRLILERETAESRRRNAEARLSVLGREVATLEEQARFALDKKRTDLAEAAITRQVEIEEQMAELDAVRAEVVADDGRLETAIADLRQRRQQMKEELTAFRTTQSAAAAVEEVSTPIDVRMSRKVARAEEAFDRAMEEAGGVSGRGANRDAPVTEIAAMQKAAAVAERLAALKAATSPKAPAKRAAR